MKEAKYLEKKIAEHLEKHYGVKYSPKTIGTRYARLKKVLARHQDELLDQGLADWHDGDVGALSVPIPTTANHFPQDDALQAAIIRAHARIAFRKQKLDDELWRLVAEALKIIKPVTNFSGKACQQRAESLEQGTALPTPETLAKRADPDPLVLERIKTRRQKEERLVEDVQQYQEGCGHVPAQPLNITEAESVNYVDQEPARIGQNADGIAHIHDEPTTSAASVHDAEVDTRRPPESTISTHIAAEEQDPAAVSDLDFLSLHDSTQAPGVLPANRFYTSADQPDFVPGTFAGPVASSFGAGIRDGFGGIGALPLIRPVGGDQMQQAWIGTVESEWERTEANLRGNSWTSWKGL